jgi:hypothetical protein
MKQDTGMADAIYRHGGRQFAMGMQWSVHETLALARSHAVKNVHAHWVHAPLQRITGTGGGDSSTAARVARRAPEQIALGLRDGAMRGTVLCGALAVGLVLRDAVICQHLDDGKVWLCVISGGLPFPDQDRIIEAEQAPQALDDVMAYASRIVGNGAAANSTLDEVLAEFERRCRDRVLSRRQLRSIRLRRLSTRTRRLVYALLPILLLLSLWMGWQLLQAIRSREQGQKLTLAALAQSSEAAAAKAAARAQLMRGWQDSVARQRSELQSGIGAVLSRWHQWDAVRAGLPLTVSGYQPVNLVCDEKRCLASWAPRSAWSRLADRELIPGLIAPPEGSDSLQSRIALPALTGMASAVAGKGATGNLQFAMAAATQFIAPEIQWTPLQPVAVAAPAELGVAPEVVGTKGQLRLQLSGSMALVRANDVMAVLAQWPVRLTSVSWNQVSSAQPSVDVQAEYVQAAHVSR